MFEHSLCQMIFSAEKAAERNIGDDVISSLRRLRCQRDTVYNKFSSFYENVINDCFPISFLMAM